MCTDLQCIVRMRIMNWERGQLCRLPAKQQRQKRCVSSNNVVPSNSNPKPHTLLGCLMRPMANAHRQACVAAATAASLTSSGTARPWVRERRLVRDGEAIRGDTGRPRFSWSERARAERSAETNSSLAITLARQDGGRGGGGPVRTSQGRQNPRYHRVRTTRYPRGVLWSRREAFPRRAPRHHQKVR